MTTTQNAITVLISAEWDLVSSEDKKKNARRHNTATHGDMSCCLCERTISDKVIDKAWHVHMTVNRELIAVGTEVEEGKSQGWFPVGSDCAKKLPKNFLKKWGV